MHEVAPSVEQQELAVRFQLPPTFFLYEHKAACRGCIGCQEDGDEPTHLQGVCSHNTSHLILSEVRYAALIWSAKDFALQLCWRVFVLLKICTYKHMNYIIFTL